MLLFPVVVKRLLRDAGAAGAVEGTGSGIACDVDLAADERADFLMLLFGPDVL